MRDWDATRESTEVRELRAKLAEAQREQERLVAKLDRVEAALCAAHDASLSIRCPPITDWHGYCVTILRWIRGETTDLGAELYRSQHGSRDPLRTIEPRQPDGYDPGARPKPEKAADSHAWAAPGVWSVADDGSGYPVKLASRDLVERPGSWWVGVNPKGEKENAAVHIRHPATPEETARFEAELAKNTAPVSIPLKVGDSFVMEHDGPNLVRLSVSEPASTEPKTSLPVVPATCGECRRFCKTTMGTWCCGTPNAMQWCAGDRPPPFWCPLRKPSKLEPAAPTLRVGARVKTAARGGGTVEAIWEGGAVRVCWYDGARLEDAAELEVVG